MFVQSSRVSYILRVNLSIIHTKRFFVWKLAPKRNVFNAEQSPGRVHLKQFQNGFSKDVNTRSRDFLQQDTKGEVLLSFLNSYYQHQHQHQHHDCDYDTCCYCHFMSKNTATNH